MNRFGVLTAALASLAGSAVIAPAESGAAGCGPGTVYDAQSDMCVLAPANPAPANPAPANPVEWNGPAPAPPPPPPPLPPMSICPPIPFVAVCFPVN